VLIAPLPFRCILAQRHLITVDPWLIWTTDDYTDTLMGFRICADRPTKQDMLLTLRWSIWHYGAPWWKARGAPDLLLMPPHLEGATTEMERRALFYIRCRLVGKGKEAIITEQILSDCSIQAHAYLGFPDTFVDWLTAISTYSHARVQRGLFDLAKLRFSLLDYLHDEWATANFAAATPSPIAEQFVSLPWSVGIAATLFLPSGGTQNVKLGRVFLFGVPFDAGACGLGDGKEVEIRYDPDDARAIYLIYDGASIVQASACTFEHHTVCSNLSTAQ
jgi:hypothetical protein